MYYCTGIVFKLQNVQIWAVPKCKGVYLVIVWNGILRLRKFQIRVVPSSKRSDLLMLMNRDFRVRNVEICSAMRLIC